MQLLDCRILPNGICKTKSSCHLVIFQYRAKKKKNADQYSPESHIKVTRIKEIFFVILYYYYYYYYYIIILLNEMYRLEKGEYAY